MNRRLFIRIVGGVGLTSTFPMRYVTGSDNSPLSTVLSTTGVLLEAAAFKELGGWKLDTQHYQQMGGCYLLAHGIGQRVANASTKIRFPKSGNWSAWVRTRDWCPGDWASPGRFRIHVSGKPLGTEFGAENPVGIGNMAGSLRLLRPATWRLPSRI